MIVQMQYGGESSIPVEDSGAITVRFLYYSTITGSPVVVDKHCDSGGTVTAPTDVGDITSTIGTSALFVNEHPALTYQGWNITIPSSITNDMVIGAMYVTADGKSYFAVRLTTVSGLALPLRLTTVSAGTLTIEWGDGNTTTDATVGNVSLSHTYSAIGDYWIKISRSAGTYGLGQGTSSTTVIGASTQNYRDTLYNIFLGNNLTSIGNYAFYFSYSLLNITIPSGILLSGTNIFQNCYSLMYISLSNGINILGASTFSACSALQYIAIPTGITGIGANAFESCKSLIKVIIPSTITSIGDRAFSDCNSLIYLSLSACTTVGNYIFQKCYSLREIIISEGFTTITTYMFAYCQSVQTMIFPSTVTSLADYSFYYCYKLHEYIFQSATPPTATSNFVFLQANNTNMIIYVPDASVNAYKTATNWTQVANYIKPISSRV